LTFLDHSSVESHLNMHYCHQTTSHLSPVEDAIFGRIDDIGDMFKREVHAEFITNCIMRADAHLFPEYSYMYVLVAHAPPDRRTEPHDSCWSDLLHPDQIAIMRHNAGFVVGYMLMTERSPTGVHLIECVDTRVPGCNLVDAMIRKYENEVAAIAGSDESMVGVKILPKCVLPKDITPSAAGYWKRFFERRYAVNSRASLEDVKTRVNIEQIVDWSPLEALYP